MARVLIVDRVPFMSNITKFALQYGGHEVVGEAADGQEAVDYYLSLQPDLIISEMILPKVSGIDLLTKLKRINPDSKIIICSTVRKDSMIEQAMSKGADSYIIKPFQIHSFLSEVSRVVGEEKTKKESPRRQNLSQEELNEMLGKILTKSITPEEIGVLLRDLDR